MEMYADAQKRDDFRLTLRSVLHDGRGAAGHAFHFVLMTLILLSLALLPLELTTYFKRYHDQLTIIEGVMTAFFTVEYGLRIYSAKSRWRYVFSFFGLIDLFAILPFYLGFFGLQSLRALRLIRLIRIGHMNAAATSEHDDVMERSVGLVHGVEGVEYIVCHHPVYMVISCLPPLVAMTLSIGTLLLFPFNAITVAVTSVLALFTLIFLWKAWLDYSYDVIYITTHRLLFQNQHLLGRSVNQVNYHAITNVKPSYTGVFSYLMGYGSIMIETAADQLGHFGMDMVKGHEKAAHLIMQKCFAAQPGRDPLPRMPHSSSPARPG